MVLRKLERPDYVDRPYTDCAGYIGLLMANAHAPKFADAVDGGEQGFHGVGYVISRDGYRKCRVPPKRQPPPMCRTEVGGRGRACRDMWQCGASEGAEEPGREYSTARAE